MRLSDSVYQKRLKHPMTSTRLSLSADSALYSSVIPYKNSQPFATSMLRTRSPSFPKWISTHVLVTLGRGNPDKDREKTTLWLNTSTKVWGDPEKLRNNAIKLFLSYRQIKEPRQLVIICGVCQPRTLWHSCFNMRYVHNGCNRRTRTCK